MGKVIGIVILIVFSSKLYSKPIKISKTSDLVFGTGAPGDSSKQIPPGTSENSSNASFQVTGDANTAYSITLPAAPITIKTGNGANSDTIEVSNFQSFPVGNGLLNASGSQNLFVGATRAALRLNQKAGPYTGGFTVTVVY